MEEDKNLKSAWNKLHSLQCELEYSLDWMVRGREPIVPKQFWQMMFKYQIKTLKQVKDRIAREMEMKLRGSKEIEEV